MLRSTGKPTPDTLEDKNNRERTNIYNKRIEKEIKNLNESKLIDNENVYITFNHIDQVDHYNDTCNSGDIKKNRYFYLLQTFNEKYFLNETFFLNNFKYHLNILKTNNNISHINKGENNFVNFAELGKYNLCKDMLCPFFSLYDTLNFEIVFNNFSSFLNEISYFLEIFEIFKNGFVKEQNVFNSLENNQQGENISYKEEKQDNLHFFTNIFFEIIYKDFTTNLIKVQREILNKLLYSNAYEKDCMYNNFLLFFHKYYSIKESMVYSFFIFDDYPFSKPCVNVDHLPFPFLRKKNQKKLTGDIYNKRNILNILLNEKKWIPKITLENLFEESQKFVHKLFFYYQYKIYLLYYYLNKHIIFSRFFEYKCIIDFETYHLVYSYVAKVDKKIVAQKKNGKIKNYSNLLYSINNCECINQDIVFYKFFYTYKKLKSKDLQVNDVENSSIRYEKKKRYEYYVYLFFLLFIFLLPLVIKNVYIHQTYEISNYLIDAKESYFAFGEVKQMSHFKKHPLFYAYINALNFVSSHSVEDTENVRKNGEFDGKDELNWIAERESNKTEGKGGERDGNEHHGSAIPREKYPVKSNLLILVLLSISEFLLFSLGVIYNLQLLRKKFQHNNFVVNVCSSMLILYNPILFSGQTNYVTVLSIGLLFWSVNMILLKRIFLSIVVYFVSIYFNVANVSYIFPFLFIYVYINSRYVIKRGNQVKIRFKNKQEIFKYILIYILLFIIMSYFLIYILSDDNFFGIRHFKKGFHFYNSYFDTTGNIFMYYKTPLKFDKTTNTSPNKSINSHSNTYVRFPVIISYIPLILTLIFNYLFVVNTIMKLYTSLMFSSILFFLTSSTLFCSNYFLTCLLVLLLLFINVLGNSSILINILFSSYIIITSENFNVSIFVVSIVYFLFHIYLMRPSSNFIRNINYQAKIGTQLVVHLFNYFVSNVIYLYKTSIKNFVMSFVIMIFPTSASSIISPPNEKDIQNIVQKKEIQKKIIFCLYSHMSQDYLIIPLSCFSFMLFLMIGTLKLFFPQVSIKISIFVLKLFTHLCLITMLLLFYTKRRNFEKYDFLSIPHSAYKRTFPLERSKKL
ncbi:conserved Plasmodium protein, unknown function [Plasmodium ovale]|uniref:Uncharacterized protein n=1 Tax=Plasmodium ovale TaxID=36330 RepID=A0A1D3TMR1_PLAOA|nr:conserved Plasmodium protein, unknown function [Plasmodium ovale]